MKMTKKLVALAITASLLSACSSTEEKSGGLLDDNAANTGNNAASMTGYGDGTSPNGQQFGADANGGDAGYGAGGGYMGLGAAFSDPANPLSTRTVYFMYDSSQVQQDFVRVISAHAQYLVNHPAQRIILEGHADERGSREYNIALGEQRAKSVLKMMKFQGVGTHQIEVVSYGEEKPDSDGINEASWQLNRRVEISYQGR